MQKKERDISIDVWRGVAVSMVLLLHAYAFTPDTNPASLYETVFHELMFGVNLFFVLSGYLISKSFDSSTSVAEFYVKRAAKIVPLYMLFLHLGILCFVIAAHLGPTDHFFRNGITQENLTLQNYAIHFFFLQGFDARHLNSMLDGSWSIVSEVYFYALYPIIRSVVSNFNRAIIFSIACFLLQLYFANDAYRYGVENEDAGFVQYYFFAGLPSFALGLCLYHFEKTGTAGVSNILKLTAALAYFIAFALSEPQMIMRHSVFMVMAVCFIGLFRFTRSPITNALAAMGRQTYSLYFTHLLLTTWVYNIVIAKAGFNLATNFAINLAVCFPLTILVSHFIFNPIDNHALRFIVRRYRATYIERSR